MKPETHPFAPFIPVGVKKLIIGSFPGKEFTQNHTVDGWYYGTNKNRFWDILSKIFNRDLSVKESKESVLNLSKIGLTDIIYKCTRLNNSNLDSNLINVEFNLAIKEIISNNSIKQIFFTSRYVENLFYKEFIEFKEKIDCVYLPSPSTRNRHYSTERLIDIYKTKLIYNSND